RRHGPADPRPADDRAGVPDGVPLGAGDGDPALRRGRGRPPRGGPADPWGGEQKRRSGARPPARGWATPRGGGDEEGAGRNGGGRAVAEFDHGIKIIASTTGRQLARVAGVPCQRLEPLESTLQATTEMLADRVFLARRGRERFVVYFEFYTYWDRNAPWDLLA